MEQDRRKIDDVITRHRLQIEAADYLLSKKGERIAIGVPTTMIERYRAKQIRELLSYPFRNLRGLR